MRFSTLSLMLTLSLALVAPLKAAIVVPPPATTHAEVPTKADIAAAKTDYKAKLAAMTAKERRAFKKEQKREMKEAIKKFRADVANGKSTNNDDQVLLIVLAIFLPPLAVYLHQGEINTKFWISLILTLLGWLPGMVYALLLVTGNISKK